MNAAQTSLSPPDQPRRIARHLVGLLAGLALVLAPVALPRAGADSSAFLSFGFEALSDGITLTGGNPNSAAFPQAQGRTPHTAAMLSTGPRGYALSSHAWPGPLASGAGSLAVLLGAPEEAAAANYPVRSEAQSPAGPHEDQQAPGFRAFAEGEVSEAFGEIEDMGDESFSAGSVHTHSRSEVAGDLGVATSRSESKDISFASGQVTIESVITTARAETDGLSGATDGSVVVSGLEVGGQPARVDEDGVHFGDQSNPNPGDAVAQQVGEQVLSQLGMEMYVTEPVVEERGNTYSYRSGSLVVVWDVFNQGQGIGVFQVGGSSALVRANPAAAPPQPPAPAPSLPAAIPTVSGSGSTGFVPTPPLAFTDPDTPPAPVLPAAPDEPIVALDPAPISADLFAGIPFALVVAALVGSWLVARSLNRIHDELAAASAASCPLEDHQ